MRLSTVATGHRLLTRLKLLMIRLVSGQAANDMLLTLTYRSEIFGGAHAAFAQALMRGPSRWSVGERELIMAYVSRLNECPFCAGAHGAIAKLSLGEDLAALAVEDLDRAPLSPELKKVLPLVRKLTLQPEQITGADVRSIRDAGVDDEAISDALYIASMCSYVNALASTLDFEQPSPEAIQAMAKALLKMGYRP